MRHSRASDLLRLLVLALALVSPALGQKSGGGGDNATTVCADGEVWKATAGVMGCAVDAVGGGAGVLDLGDDDVNESTAISEIATTGDTNSVITEPTADKMLIDFTANWPTADVCNAGDSATAFFSSGEIEDTRVTDALTIAGGTIGTSAITLVQGAAPAPTAEGVIEWETDDDHLIIGDGAAQVEFVPAEDVSGDATMTDDGVVTVADDSHSHGTSTIAGLDTADTTTGTWADARVAESNVTQHQAALSIGGAQIDSGTIPAARAGADHIDSLDEIAQGIKTAANDTDPLLLFTGGNPAGNRCLEINASGQAVAAADTCANLGPGGTPTTISQGDSNVEVIDAGTGQIDFDVDAALVGRWSAGGQLALSQYGSGSFTGTDAFWLAVDSAGNIIEEAAPGGTGDIEAVGDCTTGSCFTAASPDAALTFDNATSGTVTLQTVAGALGTVTVSLPAETGTVCTTGSVCTGYEGTLTNSAGLRAALSDEVGTGAAVFETGSPSLDGTNFTGIPDGALTSTFLKNVDEDATPTFDTDLGITDGTGDTPDIKFTPQTGTVWDLFVEDSADDFQIAVNTGNTEDLDIGNSGLGVVDVRIDGDVYANAFFPAPSSLPSVVLDDQDAVGASSVHGRTRGDLTDPGDGTEDLDLTISHMIAGTLTDAITLDADGPNIFETNGQNIRFGDATNHIQLTDAGAMTAQGSATITATDGDSATGFFSSGEIADAQVSDTLTVGSGGSVDPGAVGAAHIDAITEIAAGLKSGADVTLITGTAGLTDECAKWNADGDLVTTGAACGGAGSPGGSDTQIQYNNGGAFGGVAQLTYDDVDEDITYAPTLDVATGNETALSVNVTCNKATSGDCDGLTVNMTDTASPGALVPIEAQVGGSPRFAVNEDGRLTIGDGTNTTCLDLSGDRIYHDTNCNSTKDGGEEFLDASGGGACTAPDDTKSWHVGSLWPYNAANNANIPEPAKHEGATLDWQSADFDGSTVECVSGMHVVPKNADTSGTVTFHVAGAPKAPAAGPLGVVYSIKTRAVADGEEIDGSAITTTSGDIDVATSGTDPLAADTFTNTMSTLTWQPWDVVVWEFCREVNNVNDDLTTDFEAMMVSISIPQVCP